MDTLGHNPILGAGGSLGGWLGSMIATIPIFQFLSALFGAIIGFATIIGIMLRIIKWLKESI